MICSNNVPVRQVSSPPQPNAVQMRQGFLSPDPLCRAYFLQSLHSPLHLNHKLIAVESGLLLDAHNPNPVLQARDIRHILDVMRQHVDNLSELMLEEASALLDAVLVWLRAHAFRVFALREAYHQLARAVWEACGGDIHAAHPLLAA